MFIKSLSPIERIFVGSKMKFLVLSREEVKTVSPQIPYIVISVTDPQTVEADILQSQHRRSVLRLKFHDISGTKNEDLKSFHSTHEIAMTEEHALSVLDFVKDNLSDIQLILCHCEIGISRSAAIAAALSKILNNEDEFFFENYWPNRWVYNLILENSNVLKTL